MDWMIFVYSFAGFAIAFVLLALGYIFAKKVIKGSCASIDELGIEKACSCEKPCFARRMRMKREAAEKAKAQMNKDLGIE